MVFIRFSLGSHFTSEHIKRCAENPLRVQDKVQADERISLWGFGFQPNKFGIYFALHCQWFAKVIAFRIRNWDSVFKWLCMGFRVSWKYMNLFDYSVRQSLMRDRLHCAAMWCKKSRAKAAKKEANEMREKTRKISSRTQRLHASRRRVIAGRSGNNSIPNNTNNINNSEQANFTSNGWNNISNERIGARIGLCLCSLPLLVI